jgi:DNA repair protein RadC
VHPREVFKAAILANAAGVIVAHNHPSGDPSPSPDDVALCARLRDAGTLIGIDLLDFVTIGQGRYCSFKEMGR